jgi:hypothetical protein
MRKQVIAPVSDLVPSLDQDWLDLDKVALVEVTSEDPAYPIESALLLKEGPGWRALKPGPQTVRLIFDKPQRLRRIKLVFRETATERTQEFALRWIPDGGGPYREIVRQQWNFSPPGTIREIEDYAVDLSAVKTVELTIVPNKSGGQALASLQRFQVA